MSWILGAATLPAPQGFRREPIFIAADVTTISGKSKRDVIRRKYRYVLNFEKLTQAEANGILSEYAQDSPRTFSVSEDNLTISPVSVLIDMSPREYNTPGGDFREDLDLTLTEV